jgi:mannose-6-phosphate isomerase-like protein (cupin superfamily)
MAGLHLHTQNYQIIDFHQLPPINCPCGTARRSLMSDASVPYSLHLTDISLDAKTHYHRQTTETYLFLECDADARLELDGEQIEVRPLTAVVIYPGTRHRAVGRMKVAIIASPKFDPNDEWLD